MIFMAVQSLGTLAAAHAVKPTGAGLETILYGGRKFTCRPDMARIFLKRAREVIESGDEQLVPLLHAGGIELLLVSRATPYSLVGPAGE